MMDNKMSLAYIEGGAPAGNMLMGEFDKASRPSGSEAAICDI
jgi:hypothetical protein